MRYFFILFTTFFYTGDSFCETRNEIRDLEDRSDFNYNLKAGERLQTKENDLSKIYAGSRNIGFYDTEIGSMKSDVTATTVVSAFMPEPMHESVLVIRFFCNIPDSIVPILPRYKEIKWYLDGYEEKSKGKTQTNGETQTDSEGYARIRISSIGSVGRKVIRIGVGEFQKTLIPADGPYEIFLPENICVTKKQKKQ